MTPRLSKLKRVPLAALFAVLILGCAVWAAGKASLARHEVKNDGLFNEIRTEAAQIEVFPVDYVLLGKESIWEIRYELTFERFQPVYRFKERACAATLPEIDECVARIDELNPKEKAMVLTAICLFERTRRSRPAQYVSRLGNANDERVALYPRDFYADEQLRNWAACFPIYRPDRSISKRTWRRLEKFVGKYRDSKEIAFPAVETSESELKDNWFASIGRCVELMKTRLDPTVPWDEWSEARNPNSPDGGWSDLDYLSRKGAPPLESPIYPFSSIIPEQLDDSVTLAFLEDVASLEKSSSLTSKEVQELTALREYCFMRRSYVSSLNESAGPLTGNSSARAKTLGEIAACALLDRVPYK